MNKEKGRSKNGVRQLKSQKLIPVERLREKLGSFSEVSQAPLTVRAYGSRRIHGKEMKSLIKSGKQRR